MPVSFRQAICDSSGPGHRESALPSPHGEGLPGCPTAVRVARAKSFAHLHLNVLMGCGAMADHTCGQSIEQCASALSTPDRVALELQDFPFQDQPAQSDKFSFLVCSRPYPGGSVLFARKFLCAIKRRFQAGGIKDFKLDDCY